MRRILVHLRHRHLMGAPEAFDLVSVDLLGTGPSLGAAQDHHRPARPLHLGARSARLLLDAADFPDAVFQGRRHRLMHAGGIGAFDEIRLVAITAEQELQFVVRDAGENGGIGDLVAVQMQHRQHRAIASRIEELVRVPCGRQRPGFRLAVADHRRSRSDPGCRRRRRRRATPNSRALRPHGSNRASPACNGCRCRRETRTA